jgi:cytochrome c biogenesis protein CcmG/thiol:disulfide interchange protein DsbE
VDTPVATDTVGVEKPAAPASRGLVVKVAAVGVLAGFLGLLAWATLVPSGGSNLVARVAAGERPSAPAFDHQVAWRRLGAWPPGSSRLIDDGRLALEELRGRPAVLNFWASWCIPCRDEAPILNESARSHRGKVVFVGIDVRDLRADARAFLREFSVPYVSVRDRDDESFRAYGLSGVPETYFLDASGRIIGHTAGPVTAQTLEEGIAQVLATTVP